MKRILWTAFLLGASLGSSAFAGSASSLPVHDNDFGCTSQADANRYVKEFNIDLRSFGGMELCNGDVDTKKLFNDLMMIEQGSFSGKEKNLFIQDFVSAGDYYNYMTQMTRGVRRGHDIPYATAYNSWGNFTMQDGWTKLSTLGRVGTFIHEARHTDGFSHTGCTQGPYKDAGVAGCDNSLDEGGSHGVEMEYYSRVVLQGDNFHPVYKQMARLMNLGRANFVFNRQPMQKSAGLVALGNDVLSLVQGTSVAHHPAPSQKAAGLSLKRTSYGATLFKDHTAWALDLYEAGQQPELIRDEYSYFKLLLDNRINDVSDYEEVDIGVKRYLVALSKSGQLYTFIFPQGQWSQPVSAGDGIGFVTVAPTGEEGLFIVNRQGDVFPLNPSTLRRGPKVAVQWPNTVADYVKWQGQTLAVTTSGDVIDAQSSAPFAPLKGEKVEQMISAPLYDAYGL